MTNNPLRFEDLYLEPSRNGVYKSKEYQGLGTPVVKMNELFDNKTIRPSEFKLDKFQLTENEKRSFLLRDEDLLFARTSVVPEGVGKCSIVEKVGEEVAFESNIIRVRLDHKKVNPRYLAYFFQSSFGRSLILAISNGVAIRTIRGSDLKNIVINIPDRKTQDRVAYILSTYDKLIKNNHRRVQLLDRSVHLLYKEWFIHLRFPEHERVNIIDGVPEGWEKTRLGEKIVLNYGKALKANDRIEGSYPVYGSSGIIGTHEEALVKGPGIIIGRKGNVGSVFWSSKDFYPIDTVYFINSEVSNYYLYNSLKNMQFINSDGAVPGLNRNYAYSRLILLPDNKLLSLFEGIVSPIYELIQKLETYNEKLVLARDLLLHRLMNGEIVV